MFTKSEETIEQQIERLTGKKHDLWGPLYVLDELKIKGILLAADIDIILANPQYAKHVALSFMYIDYKFLAEEDIKSILDNIKDAEKIEKALSILRVIYNSSYYKEIPQEYKNMIFTYPAHALEIARAIKLFKAAHIEFIELPEDVLRIIFTYSKYADKIAAARITLHEAHLVDIHTVSGEIIDLILTYPAYADKIASAYRIFFGKNILENMKTALAHPEYADHIAIIFEMAYAVNILTEDNKKIILTNIRCTPGLAAAISEFKARPEYQPLLTKETIQFILDNIKYAVFEPKLPKLLWLVPILDAAPGDVYRIINNGYRWPGPFDKCIIVAEIKKLMLIKQFSYEKAYLCKEIILTNSILQTWFISLFWIYFRPLKTTARLPFDLWLRISELLIPEICTSKDLSSLILTTAKITLRTSLLSHADRLNLFTCHHRERALSFAASIHAIRALSEFTEEISKQIQILERRENPYPEAKPNPDAKPTIPKHKQSLAPIGIFGKDKDGYYNILTRYAAGDKYRGITTIASPATATECPSAPTDEVSSAMTTTTTSISHR